MLRSNRGSLARPGSSRHSRPGPYSVTGHLPTRQQPSQTPQHHVQQQPGATHHDSICQICQIPHKHFSSLRLREMLGVEGTEKFYFCPTCKSSHRSNTRNRVKLVVSDSSLHQFFAPPGDSRARETPCILTTSPSLGVALTSSTKLLYWIWSFCHQENPLTLFWSWVTLTCSRDTPGSS